MSTSGAMASFTSSLHYTWDQVVTCFWKKYPNTYSKHVLSEDCIERKLLRNGDLYTKRIISKTSPVPKFATRIFPKNETNVVFVVEESIVSHKNKNMTIFTWNVGNLVKIMKVTEKITFSPAENNTRTNCHKVGNAESSTWYGWRTVIKKYGVSKWQRNAEKAQKGLEEILALNYVPQSFPEPVKHTFVDQTKESMKNVKEKAKSAAVAATALKNQQSG